MRNKTKKKLIFFIFALCIGAIVGGVIWAFLRILSLGTELIWNWLPEKLSIPFYTLLVCTFGGFLVGIAQKKIGAYPESLHTVVAKVKKDGRYPYDNLGKLIIAALLPLLFGASLGPEAGMTGVIVGLCCWAGDRLAGTGRNLRQVTQIGISTTLGVLFQSPLFGVMEPLEPEADMDKDVIWPRASRIAAYSIAVIGGLAAVYVLSQLFGGSAGLPRLEHADIQWKERIWGIPLAFIGILLGFWFIASEKISAQMFAVFRIMPDSEILCSVIGGIILGVCGMLLPLTMFSGEEQLEYLMENMQQYSAWMLIVISLVKVLVTQICLSSGWRGGHFFPVIFCGASLGCSMALITGCDPVFCVSVVTAGVLGVVMRKPLSVVLLLLLCFPARTVPWMIAAAFLGSNMPIPRSLKAGDR